MEPFVALIYFFRSGKPVSEKFRSNRGSLPELPILGGAGVNYQMKSDQMQTTNGFGTLPQTTCKGTSWGDAWFSLSGG